MPPIHTKAPHGKTRSNPLARHGRQLGSGDTVGPSEKRALVKLKDNDDDYDPEREERSASPEGPEAEEVAQELVDLEEQDAFTEVVDAKGRSLGMVRVGGNDISNEPAKTTDEAIIDELKNLDKFKENSARLAVRMALTWERAATDEAVKDDSFINASESANDRAPAQNRKLVPCSNGSYVKEGGKFRQLSDEELQQLGRSFACICRTCKNQRKFASNNNAQEAEWKKMRDGKSFNSVGNVLGSG